MNSRFCRMAALAAALLLPPFAVAADDDDSRPRRRVRIGGVMVGASYMTGPAWYPYYHGYGPYSYWSRWTLYDPFWTSPFIHPALYSGYGQRASTGGVKLITPDKDASVYIDGAYAGQVQKLKTIWLEPGAYNLEVRGTGGGSYERRVYVLTGKTLEIKPELRAEAEARP